MRYFPLFLDLQGARVVVVGGGEEALRKVRLLAKTVAAIDCIAPALLPEFSTFSQVNWIAKTYNKSLLKGAALVISSDPQLNICVSADARSLGIPVNAVDDAALSTFIVPSIVDRDPVVVAIGTEGAAPVLAQNLRAKIDALLPANLGAVTRRAQSLRTIVAERLAHGLPRRKFWADFFFGSVAETLKQNDAVAYELALGDALFNHSIGHHGKITRLTIPADLDLLTLRDQRALMEADFIVHPENVPVALLEMARRDAVRLLPHQIDSLENVEGNILHISLPQISASAFPVREELGEALLRAVS